MKIFYLLGIIILIIIIFYFFNNYNFIIEKFADSNYTAKKLDFGFNLLDTRVNIIDDYKIENIKTPSDALNYYKSKCNKSDECVSFLEPEFNPKYPKTIYLNNKINNKLYNNIYINDRDQNNSQINYKKIPNSSVKDIFNSDMALKMIAEKQRYITNDKDEIKINDVSLPTCEKICNDDKDCYGIQTGPVRNVNACITFNKKILDSSNIIPASYGDITLDGVGKASNIYYKNDYLNSIPSKESSNNNVISNERNNNYTEKKLDFMPSIDSIMNLDIEGKNFNSKKIDNKEDYMKYAYSECDKNNDSVGFISIILKTINKSDGKVSYNYVPPIFFNKKISDKKYENIYLNDRNNQNNSKINYTEMKNKIFNYKKKDNDFASKIDKKKPFEPLIQKNLFSDGSKPDNIVNLDICKKKCDDDKECNGIFLGYMSLPLPFGDMCMSLNKNILEPDAIIPVNYEDFITLFGEEGSTVSINYKNSYLNSISVEENKAIKVNNNSVSTEGTNNYTKKKLDHLPPFNDMIIANPGTNLKLQNYIDTDKIKNIKTYDDLLNYNKLMCDKNKDCFGFLINNIDNIDKKELDKKKPEDFQKMAETNLFFNNKITDEIHSNIYVNDRNENNSTINYKKIPNSTETTFGDNNIIDYIVETEKIYNKDDKKWETKKNDVSLETCKKKCNDNKDCYGIGDFDSPGIKKACITYKKDILKPENIKPEKEKFDPFIEWINNYGSLYYKDPPNKIPSKNTGIDITGSHPSQSGSSWSNNLTQKTKNILGKEDCEVGSLCSTENGFGIYNNDCYCIVNNEEEKNLEEENKEIKKTNDCNLICNAGENKNNLSHNLNNIINTFKCYPNNTNFSKICQDQNPTYGVKEINICDDKNTSSVVCDPNYLNGKYIGQPIITPCLNKTDDFDVWCKYYNTKPVPNGYNINSIGLKNLLVGKDGECYLNNNLPDNSKARGICDYNYINNITKINSSNLKNNNFTDCSPINSNFNILCSNLSKKSMASEIMGYDCNPGFARAKCIDGDNLYVDNNSSNNLSDNKLINNVFDDKKNNSANFCETNCKKN